MFPGFSVITCKNPPDTVDCTLTVVGFFNSVEEAQVWCNDYEDRLEYGGQPSQTFLVGPNGSFPVERPVLDLDIEPDGSGPEDPEGTLEQKQQVLQHLLKSAFGGARP